MMFKQKNINNFFNLINKLTFRKAINIAKIYTSFYIARFTKKPIQWGVPFSISIEPTTSCNLRCPECPSGLRSFTRPTGMLEENFFQKVIDEMKQDLLYLTFYFQGEPYLHPKFLNMVNYAHKRGIYTSTSTNAHYLSKENAIKTINSGLDRIIISIDGITQETYKQYRIGGKLSKVLEGTKNIIEAKNKLNSQFPYVIFQFLVVKPNEHEIEEVKKIAEEMGVDEVIFKTAQIYDYENGNPLIPENDKFSRYRKLPSGKYEIKNKLINSCWKLWHSCVITWDGKVVPCCFDKDANYDMGNLSNQAFLDIWHNPKYRSFRTKLLSSRKEIDICSNCSEGTQVNFNYEL